MRRARDESENLVPRRSRADERRHERTRQAHQTRSAFCFRLRRGGCALRAWSVISLPGLSFTEELLRRSSRCDISAFGARQGEDCFVRHYDGASGRLLDLNFKALQA